MKLFVFFILIFSITNIPFLRSQQLTQDEFENQLMKACLQSNDQIVLSLIRDHRLMVKPFVDKCISESIQMELEGEVGKSQQKQSLAEKTASTFKNIHGEKSLVIAVNYLSLWSKEQKEKKVLADSLFALGTSIRGNRQQHEKAIEYYQQALDIYTEIGDERGEAGILGGLGFIYWSIDYQTCLSYYQKALEVREKIDDKQLMGASLNGIGLVYSLFLMDYDKAIEYFDKAAGVRTEIGDWSSLGSTLSYKASAYEKMGQFELAVKYFEQSFEINKKAGNQLQMAEAMLNSGTNLHQTGKYPEALEDLETAIEIYRSLEDTIGTGDVLTQMGFVYANVGDYNTAIEKCTEALKLMKEVNDSWGMAGVYNNMGVILQSAGRSGKAAEYYKNAIEIYEELNAQYDIIGVLNNLGTVSFDLGDFEKAEEYHYRGLQLSRELKSKILEVHCLLNMANDQNRLGKLDEALSNYESGFQIARSLNSPETVWKTMVGMAENYKLRGEYDKAIEYNEKGLAIIEEMRSSMQSDEFKANYMAKERYAFEDVINMLGELHEKDSKSGYDIKAFQLAEQSKSRALLDLLTESIANVYEGADQELLAEQEKILTRLNLAKQQLEAESAYDNADDQIINSIKEDIKSKEEELNAIKIKIRSTNPRYAELQYPQPVSINELQTSCLDKNTLLLEYSLGDISSWLWVISRNKHYLFKLPGRNTLHEQIELLRFSLQNPGQGSIDFFAESSYKLYQQLIQPAESFFSKNTNLVIIPDGILNYLPFEVLLTDRRIKSVNQSYSDLSYLVLKHTINYVQSASVLNNLIMAQNDRLNTGKTSRGLIAFGDPVYESEGDTTFLLRKGLGRLEYSGKEVEKIASYFPAGESKTYLREKATEENVKTEKGLENFRYIHFATHGLIDERKPDFSCLVLTQDEDADEDGFLQAAEIFNLNMDADLVVLSACQTGLGKMVRGEGMVGLTRAFMYAGTPSVLVSLWSVSDVSTASFMEKFYSHLIVGKLTKTEALQKAQLSLIKEEQYAHPFYWAPFVLIGNWK